MSNLKIYTCKVCKDKFKDINNVNIKYCSDFCRKQGKSKNALDRYYKKIKPIEGWEKKGYKQGNFKFNCDVCGKVFNQMNNNHKICSDKCRRNRQEETKSFKFFNKSSSPYSYLKLRFEIFKRDCFKCIYCGRSPKEDGCKLHLDHIIPKSKGGKNIPSNLITSCLECNLGKSDILLEERDLI